MLVQQLKMSSFVLKQARHPFKRFGLLASGGFKRPLETSNGQPRISTNNIQSVTCYRYLQSTCSSYPQSEPSPLLCGQVHSGTWVTQICYKSKKASRSNADSDGYDSDGSEDEDQEESKDFKVLKGHVNSARIDVVLKFALGMSRNKVENAFYSNSIYLNGEKLDKKKHTVAIEDEVDVVRGQNTLNPSFIDVQRVEVIDIHHSRTDPDKVTIKVRRFKRLTIDNYERPWKPPASE